MPALITYADTENRFHDTRKITLDKILQALNGGAGGGGSGVLSGSGPPSAGLSGKLYLDETNKDLYGKIAGTWETLVDVV